jgi:uncharacterized protein
MEQPSKATRLRIYASSTDKIEHSLLSEYIVNLAHTEKMAGATVLKGIIGFGASSVIHSYKLWEISEKVPIVIEVIDKEDKIRQFYELVKPVLEAMRYGCMVTSENIEVILYKTGTKKSN